MKETKSEYVGGRITTEAKQYLERVCKSEGIKLGTLISRYLMILSEADRKTMHRVFETSKGLNDEITELNEQIIAQRQLLANGHKALAEAKQEYEDARAKYEEYKGLKVAYSLGVAQKKKMANGEGPEMDVVFTKNGEPIILKK